MHVDCRFVRINPLAKLPRQAEEQALGMDLFLLPGEKHVSEYINEEWQQEKVGYGFDPGEVKILPTGLVGIPPIGYHYEILLRSSTPKRYPGLLLANHVGLIDPSYCGPEDELKVAFYNSTGSHQFLDNVDIEKKPLVQIVVRANIFGKIEEVSKEDYNNMYISRKSRGGFGSTNKE